MDSSEREFFEENLQSMVEDIRELVECESPSSDPELLMNCSRLIESLFNKRLSSKAEKVSIEGKSPILIFRFGPDTNKKPVLLMTHYDTVHSKGTIKDFPFANDSGVLRGPGVFDMKTGLVQAIWALKYLKDNDMLNKPVILMSTPDEEIGSKSSRKTIEEYGKQCEYAVVLEASAEGMIKTGRKGTGRFSVTVVGRAAHAGLEPEKGINAIEEMSRIVLELQKLNKNDKGTTVNVGTIIGGTTSNVVPAEAKITVDIRVWSQEEAERIASSFKTLKPVNEGASLVVEGDFDRPPMTCSESTRKIVNRIKEISLGLGKKLEDTAVGGASDGNLVAPLGVPVIDGFGAVGGGAHSRSEWVDVQEIPFRALLLAKTLIEV